MALVLLSSFHPHRYRVELWPCSAFTTCTVRSLQELSGRSDPPLKPGSHDRTRTGCSARSRRIPNPAETQGTRHTPELRGNNSKGHEVKSKTQNYEQALLLCSVVSDIFSCEQVANVWLFSGTKMQSSCMPRGVMPSNEVCSSNQYHSAICAVGPNVMYALTV